MEASTLVIVLALGTLVFAAAFAFASKRATEKRMEKDNSVKSTLAADKDSHGKPTDV